MTRHPTELTRLLAQLIARWEHECVEFKEANDNFSTSDIGKYFSALSNEANLRSHSASWLVFGVRNEDRKVVGTSYRENPERLQSLKKQIADGTGASTFRSIVDADIDGHRVILFEIPPAPRGLPVAWNGHYYARDHESLVALSDSKRDEIRSQTADPDWSAESCPGATFSDLDPDAIAKAREAFTAKQSDRLSAATIAAWSDAQFLDRAGITISGRITRTAILLLGRTESVHHLSPGVAEMTWSLEGEERAYQHFHPPFVLTSSLLYQRIRNIKLTLLRPGDLIPLELPKYDQRIVLEALHNCIAHQDYAAGERIVVTERPQELIFRNAGCFYDGRPDDYIASHHTPTRYRNRFLATAMVNLRMIDTMGFGIHDIMFRGQAKRFFPLPDYDTTDPNHVCLRLPGRFIDENYSRALLAHPEMSFTDILALDAIQKGRPIADDALARSLKQRKLIEGRKPHYRVATDFVTDAGQRADYIKHRAFDDSYYCDLVLEYLRKFSTASREDINRLLLDKLSEALTPRQKRRKISNLLQKMRRQGQIDCRGATAAATWFLPPSYQDARSQA